MRVLSTRFRIALWRLRVERALFFHPLARARAQSEININYSGRLTLPTFLNWKAISSPPEVIDKSSALNGAFWHADLRNFRFRKSEPSFLHRYQDLSRKWLFHHPVNVLEGYVPILSLGASCTSKAK